MMLKTFSSTKRWIFDCTVKRTYCQALYTQGQRVDKRIREYFYYIDHEGMVNKNYLQTKCSFNCASTTKIGCVCVWSHFNVLCWFPLSLSLYVQQLFLDDARIKNFTSCFKDKQFLRFFFKRLRFNATPRYQHEFPYVSLCGVERNYIRCDDLPIVFTDVIANDKGKWNYPKFFSLFHFYGTFSHDTRQTTTISIWLEYKWVLFESVAGKHVTYSKCSNAIFLICFFFVYFFIFMQMTMHRLYIIAQS